MKPETLSRIKDIETAVNSTRLNPIMFAYDDMDFMVRSFREIQDLVEGKEESK